MHHSRSPCRVYAPSKVFSLDLSDEQVEVARKWVEEINAELWPLLILFTNAEKPFPTSVFNQEMFNLSPLLGEKA